MSNRFVSKSDTKTIRADWWDKGEEVVIKKYSYGDRQHLTNAVVGSGVTLSDAQKDDEGEKADKEVSMNVDIYEMKLLAMELGIVSWTFRRDNGDLIPINRNMLDSLVEDDGDYIEDALGEFNPTDVNEERLEKMKADVKKVETLQEKKGLDGTS